MLSLSNFFAQFMSKFLTMIFTLEFTVFSIPGGTGKALPETPADYTPVVRFAVCSDNHLSGEEDRNAEHLRNTFKDVYAYSDSCDYNKLDAFVFVGDMTNGGRPHEYEQFNAIVNEGLRDETQLITVMGNHEFIAYRDEDPTVGYDMYKQYINEDVDTTFKINGYNFIGVSYSDDAKTFKTKKEWLNTQIKAAVADTGDKPVFVFQHPQPFNTVYGSITWGDFTVKTIYAKYPQVVDFSGHSHYASTDPRSIWQGSFTSIGTGSTAALMGNLNYISGDEDAPGESGSCWIVEADANGNIRLKLMDIVNHRLFEKTDYYLSDVAKKSAHRYTWANLKSLDTKPAFPNDAKLDCVKNDDATVSLTFPDAECFWNTENYKISVSKNGKNVYSETVISNYVRTVSDGMNVNLGTLDNGTYKVSVVPYSPYANGGTALTGEITVA